MEQKTVIVEEPHVLLFPFPAQGTETPMLALADLLSLGGIRITFLNTEHIHSRLLRHSPALARLAQRPRFRFQTIPDGLPEDDSRPFVQFLDVEESMRTRSREQYKQLLCPGCDGWPKVTCVLTDGILRLALEAAEEVGVPAIVFRTSSVCSVWAYHHLPKLISEGELPFPEQADLDEMIRGVPGMEGILRRRDLPNWFRNTKSVDDHTLQFTISVSQNTIRGKALILNTFESLDSDILSRMRSNTFPDIYTLGPLHMLRKAFHEDDKSAVLSPNSTSSSLWQEDMSCLTWLDSQPRKSVVFVSFGSVTVVSRRELMEFWHGLVDSGHRFLWVMRKDMVMGEKDDTMVPPEVEEATKEKGCLVAWAPQGDVLAHPAVGCFLTHSGWNSTLESIAAGVPMICWPFFADQLTNSRFVSEVWRVGLDLKDKCESSAVEKMVREVMQGDKADELRDRATRMAELAKKSVEEGGTSYANLKSLIKYIKSIA